MKEMVGATLAAFLPLLVYLVGGNFDMVSHLMLRTCWKAVAQ